MELEIWRYSSDDVATLGFFMLRGDTWRQLGYTCEDEYRAVKVPGHTRIAAGRYPITLRTGSPVGDLYAKRFPEIYKGMLWIREVPGFTYCYVECGNVHGDTRGCVLIAEGRREMTRSIVDSAKLYARVYPRIAAAVEAEGCWLTIRDLDRPVLPSPG